MKEKTRQKFLSMPVGSWYENKKKIEKYGYSAGMVRFPWSCKTMTHPITGKEVHSNIEWISKDGKTVLKREWPDEPLFPCVVVVKDHRPYNSLDGDHYGSGNVTYRKYYSPTEYKEYTRWV